MRLMAYLLFSVLGVATTAEAASVFLEIRPQALVDKAEVRLADVADILTRDVNLAEQLGRVAVGQCKSLVKGCRLDKTTFESLVETRAAELGAQLAWSSTETIYIKGRNTRFSLLPAAEKAAIRILLQVDQGRPLAISLPEGPMLIDIPPGEIAVLPAFDRGRRSGNVIEVPLLVSVDGMVVAQPTIRYLLHRTSAGSDRRISNESTTRSDSSAAQNVILKDKKVRLLIESGSVRVEAEGIALADAGIGDAVTVKLANGLVDVRGRLIDSGTVLALEN